MKIIELRAENVKRLKVIEIRPNGNLVEISGRNGQGKSSVLDCIWYALAGAGNVCRAPIRKGEHEARIRLDLGDIRITRTFKQVEGKPFTTSIVVEDPKGLRYPSPQKVLDSLLGELSFDPLAFVRMSPKEQLEALKSFVPDVDFAEVETKNKKDLADRTQANRDAKALRARENGIVLPMNAPIKRLDDTALVAELEKAGQYNAELEKRKARREEANRTAKDYLALAQAKNQDADKLLARIQDLRAEAARLLADAEDITEKLKTAGELPPPIDTAEVRQRIEQARAANARYDEFHRAKTERDRLAQEARAVEELSKQLTASIEARNEAKQAAIKAAQMPVAGLGFGDDEILLNDLPFDQASDAERLRTSIAIAMAANPKLRVIRVRDGSLLDDEAMRLLAEMADAQDYQVWIETVGSGRLGFVLENGEIKTEIAEAAE